MQINREHIDELLFRKIGNMEMTPPEDGWQRIENELNHHNKTVHRFWMAAASIALLLSTFATAFYLYKAESKGGVATIAISNLVRDNATVVSNSAAQPANRTTQGNIRPAAQPVEAANITDPAKNGATVANAQNSFPGTEAGSSQNVSASQSQNTNTVSALSKTQTPVYADTPWKANQMQSMNRKRVELLMGKLGNKPMSIPENKPVDKPIMMASNVPVYDDFYPFEIPTESKKPNNKWEISGQFAPTYSYRVITDPDNKKKSDFSDNESALLAYSGGVKVAYQVMSRFSVQTGVFYTQMGQTINNLYVSSNNTYARNFIRTSSGSVAVTSNMKSSVGDSGDERIAAAVNASYTATSTKYQMVERMDYLEIPMLLRYKLVDRKFIFSVLGGMSTNILVSNNVFKDNGDELIKDGTLLKARPVNYNSSFGLGMSYQINSSLLIGVEPLFKYFLQSYTTDNTNHPYSFGIFTGVVYQF
jgi:hypothetical protein